MNGARGYGLGVCLFADSFLPKIGGMELAIHHLANALSAHGCRVTVVAKHYKGEMPREMRYALKQYGNRFPGSGRIGADAVGAILALKAAQRRYRFDIVNCHSASYAGSRVFLSGRLGLLNLPVVMTPHGEDIQVVPELNYGLRLSKKWDTVIRRNLRSADSVTAISDTVRRQLSFIDQHHIHDIPNGIHLADFQAPRHGFLHRQLSIAPESKIVLSVGRQRAVKGYEFGIRAFADLNRHHAGHGLKYVIIGKDTHLLAPLVKSLGLEGVVYLLPQMAYRRLIPAYASAWCFLSPSLSEGLSLVSIEAMACGLPLVVTDVPGNADIIRDNECGMTVRPKDPLAIGQVLSLLSRDAGLHRRFADKAAAGAVRYDWSTIAGKYIDVYRHTLSQFRKNRSAPQKAPFENIQSASSGEGSHHQ
jgi:glycosyltransferase involved in cell wall biosynthesis